MRWARSAACSSTAGFHHGSSRKTWSAAVRLRPTPAGAQRDQQDGRAVGRLEAADHPGPVGGAAVQALEGEPGGLELAARPGRGTRSTARRPAPCAPRPRPPRGSRAAPRAWSRTVARWPGTSARWQAAWRRRSRSSSASSTLPPAAAWPRPRAARRRARRRRRRAPRPTSSQCSTASVRGGSSFATSRFRRRSTNGAIRARRCAAAPGIAGGDRARVALAEVARAHRAGPGSRSGAGSTARRAGSRPACRSG